MKRTLLLLVVLFGVGNIHLTAEDPAAKTPASPSVSCQAGLPQVRPGEDVLITCNNLPAQSMLVYIKGVADQASGKGMKLAPVVLGDQLKFRVPEKTQPGLYSVSTAATETQEPVFVPDQLDVMGPPAIDAIYALTNYPAEKGFNFEIRGKNFASPTSTDVNVIEVVDVRTLGPCSTNSNPPPPNDTPCGEIVAKNTNEIVIKGFYPRHYYGPLKIKVHVGKFYSDQASATFAPVSPQGVALAAAFVFFVVAYVLYRLVTKGVKEIVNGVTSTPWASLFLDRETNSYSLSKFQVIAWTAVTVYSYVYLFLCRTLIQGDFRFPDVSQNLPQLFFVSAGTTVAAAAITATVGSKGAGPVQPSAADFISTGGLVAGDRFQFFTWTIVGCIGYVYLVIRMNPEMPNITLPDIPQNFLYLMGVSSAGYLGGKLVRKPGPVIKVLSVAKVTPPAGGASISPATPLPASNTPSGAPAASPDQFQLDARKALGDYAPKDDTIKIAFPVLTLNVKGENLDPTGKIKVDDQLLRGDMFWINGQRDPQSGFCTDINLSLNEASQYIEGTKPHTLMLVNTDGQSATMNFPIDPMSIDPIADLTAEKPAEITVKGKNFVDGTTFEWRNPANAKEPSAVGTAILQSVTDKSAPDQRATLKLTFAAGPPGMGKLTLISPIGLRASANVNVR